MTDVSEVKVETAEESAMEKRIACMIAMIESNNIEGFLNDIDKMAASKAYLVIRDNITTKHIKAIKESGKDNYQKFQDIKIRAKQSWEYDHKTATMEDVNRACMNVYTLALTLMRAQNGDFSEELGKVHSAINRIEEKLGIEPTVWDVEIPDEAIVGGNENVSDVQGIEKNI